MESLSRVSERPAVAADVDPVWARTPVLLPVFLVVSAVAGMFPSFSLRSNLLVLGVGGTLFWLGLSSAVPRRPSPRRLGAPTLWWLLPAVVLGVVELVNFVLGSTYDHPTLSKLTDPLLERYPVRAATFFAWLCAFWGLVRR